ncbi:hypothetical protein EIP86_008943 [Pleurotus ostreatoroseus]|nr:hypothetical protein EIP86_008943 [Pleurotus ostreatoroseus]
MFNGRDPGSYNLLWIFPWIEAEEASLKLCQNTNAHARNLALTQFFKVLKWFRHVLVQDMAVLYLSRPQALIFIFSPFNTLNFRQFALGAKLKIDAAEETARLRLQNLPENLVRSVQGAMTNMDLKLEQDRKASAARLATLETNLDGLKELLTEAFAKPSQKRRRMSESPAASSTGTPPPAISQRNSRLLYTPPALAAVSTSTVAVPPAPHPHSSHLLTPSPADFEQASMQTFEHVSAPLTTLSHLQQLPPHGLLPTIAHSNVTIIIPLASPTQMLCPLPGAFEAPRSTAQPVAVPADVCMQASEPAHSEDVPHTLMPPANGHGAGALPPAPPLALHQLTPPHSQPDDPQAAAKWVALVSKHRNINISQHPTWFYTNGEWIPVYEYRCVQCVMDIWDEWVDGHTPYLPVRFMIDVRGAKWRFNDHSLKTEAWRRSKVINLVETLQKKLGWSITLVRRFLEEKYGSFTARKFCDYLTKNLSNVLAAANAFP